MPEHEPSKAIGSADTWRSPCFSTPAHSKQNARKQNGESLSIHHVQPSGSLATSRDRKSTRLNSSHSQISYSLFFFNDTATTEIYTLSLHDALPISRSRTPGSRTGNPYPSTMCSPAGPWRPQGSSPCCPRPTSGGPRRKPDRK